MCAYSLSASKLYEAEKITFGGERGIRTLDKVAPVPPFQGGDLNRSSSSPFTMHQSIAGGGLYTICWHQQNWFSEYHIELARS